MKLLLAFLISFNAVAMTPIKKGEVAPNDGFFLTKEEEQKHYERNEKQKQTIIKLEDLRVIDSQIIAKKDEQIKVQDDSYHKLREEHYKSNNLVNILYFIGGAVLTGAISYATIRTIK
jgi:hypothetical protein